MREEEIAVRIAKSWSDTLSKPIAKDQLRTMMRLFYTNGPDLVTENTIDAFVIELIKQGRAEILKQKIATAHEEQIREKLSESGASLYCEYYELQYSLSMEVEDTHINQLISQYHGRIALYAEYGKQLRVIGPRGGLEFTLCAAECDLLWKDFLRKLRKDSNLSVQKFICEYIDDVRTLYQLARGKKISETEQEWCADQYKRERAGNGISPFEFVENYSPTNSVETDQVRDCLRGHGLFLQITE